MKTKVKVTDDTFRRPVMLPITKEVRKIYYEKHGKLLPDSVKMLPAVDRQGRKVMETVRVTHVFEGRRLGHAVTRARRWIRNNRPDVRPPHHIALFLAAFHKADPDGFKQATAS